MDRSFPYHSHTPLSTETNSPSRFAGDLGGDLGPLPYTVDQTPGLYGRLWINTTLTIAVSPYTSAGDLTLPPNYSPC